MLVKEGDDVSLEGLTAEPAELLPVPRGKAPRPNPMAEHLMRSWNEERPLSIKADGARQALSAGRALRKAAMREGIGVTIQYHELVKDKGKVNEVYCPESKVPDLGDATIRVVFQAREKTEAARRESDDK